MPEHEVNDYLDALANLKDKEATAQQIVNRVGEELEQLGKPTDVLRSWHQLRVVDSEGPMDEAAWRYGRANWIDISGWPLSTELKAALGQRYTAKFRLKNAWKALREQERRQV